jgi:hypothetical protein
MEEVIRSVDFDFIRCLDYATVASLASVNTYINSMLQPFLNVDESFKIAYLITNLAAVIGDNDATLFTNEEILYGQSIMGKSTCINLKTKEMIQGIGVTHYLEIKNNTIYCGKTFRYNMYGIFSEKILEMDASNYTNEQMRTLVDYIEFLSTKPTTPFRLSIYKKNDLRAPIIKFYHNKLQEFAVIRGIPKENNKRWLWNP